MTDTPKPASESAASLSDLIKPNAVTDAELLAVIQHLLRHQAKKMGLPIMLVAMEMVKAEHGFYD